MFPSVRETWPPTAEKHTPTFPLALPSAFVAGLLLKGDAGAGAQQPKRTNVTHLFPTLLLEIDQGGSINTTEIGKHCKQVFLFFFFPGEPVVKHLPAYHCC